MRAARLRTGYRLMAGASLAILTCLVLVILHTVPSWGAKGHAHMSEQVMGSRSFKLFTGRNNTMTRNSTMTRSRQGQTPEWRSESRATKAEIRELLSQVARDLEPWKDGISLEMVERLYCVPESVDTLRFQFIAGRPYLVGANPSWQSRMRTMQKQIMDLASQYTLPDVDFIMSTSDSCQDWNQLPMSKDGNATKCDRNAPLFSFCHHKYQPTCVSMPDFALGGWPEAFMPDWRSTRQWLSFAADQVPFRKRKPRLYWRGGGTNLQRQIMDESGLVQESELIDVHLMHWGSGHDDPQFKEEFTSLPEHCHFKHLLHLGGISYSARLRNLLLCKSAVVFPYDYDWEPKEFWYHMLKDHENIMLTGKVDDQNWGGNVVEVMQELAKNQTLAEEVGKRGHHLAAEILHPDNINKYWIELFTQYNQLMTFKPKLHKDAVPLEIALMRPEQGILSRDRTCNVC